MSDAIVHTRFGDFTFGAFTVVEQAVMERVVDAIVNPGPDKRRVLGGRGRVTTAELPGVGLVVVKHYKRGGILRYLVRQNYIRFGRSRPEVEFRLLDQVRACGVNAPEPIAFVTRGSLLYQGWLVTRAIEHERSLAELSIDDEDRTRQVMPELARQIALLIKNKLYHIDLHPGNVLVDQADKVYLLDFDKACQFPGKRNTLRDLYLRRWRRAVIKHELPESLSELVCVELRKNHERIAAS